MKRLNSREAAAIIADEAAFLSKVWAAADNIDQQTRCDKLTGSILKLVDGVSLGAPGARFDLVARIPDGHCDFITMTPESDMVTFPNVDDGLTITALHEAFLEAELRRDQGGAGPVPYTEQEAAEQFVDEVVGIAKYWAETPNQTIADRCDGVAFSMLVLLDGGHGLHPACTVTINESSEDKAFRIGQGEKYYDEGTVVTSTSLHDLLHDAVVRRDGAVK